MDVFVVQHVHEIDEDDEDVKFIGVYSTEESARRAQGERSHGCHASVGSGRAQAASRWSVSVARAFAAPRLIFEAGGRYHHPPGRPASGRNTDLNSSGLLKARPSVFPRKRRRDSPHGESRKH